MEEVKYKMRVGETDVTYVILDKDHPLAKPKMKAENLVLVHARYKINGQEYFYEMFMPESLSSETIAIEAILTIDLEYQIRKYSRQS